MKNIKTYSNILFEAKQDTANFFFLAAVSRMDLEQALDMISMGADPNTLAKDWSNKVPMGHGCLHFLVDRAVSSKSKKMIKGLVEAGADPNLQGANADTPLHVIASSWGYNKNRATLIKLLVDLGADINRKNNRGMTPLESLLDAVGKTPATHRREYFSIIKALISEGATVKNPIEIYDFFSGEVDWWKDSPAAIKRFERAQDLFGED